MHYITPTEYRALPDNNDPRSLEELRNNARQGGMCFVCESAPVWRLAGTGMCFTCTTGEADDSDDYELVPED